MPTVRSSHAKHFKRQSAAAQVKKFWSEKLELGLYTLADLKFTAEVRQQPELSLLRDIALYRGCGMLQEKMHACKKGKLKLQIIAYATCVSPYVQKFRVKPWQLGTKEANAKGACRSYVEMFHKAPLQFTHNSSLLLAQLWDGNTRYDEKSTEVSLYMPVTSESVQPKTFSL